MFYQKVRRNVQCLLCPHNCILHEGKTGKCGVRQNIGGRIKCQVYGLVSGYHFDPIEKKPLYHFFPGKKILSVGSYGCNLSCNFCQNWQISLACQLDEIEGESKTVSQIIDDALSHEANIGIAYTYNEPTVWYEFMHDLAHEAKSKGLKNVMVTNGYINTEPLELLLELIDAFNVDLKGFTNSFYREMAGGNLNPVLASIKQISKHQKHLELTTLVIPRKNDNLEKFKEMVLWIQGEIGENTVLHLSRYFPKYKQILPATSEKLLLEMAELASEKLKHVYIGNMNTETYATTRCSYCHAELIYRNGYTVGFSDDYFKGTCLNCKHEIIANDILTL